MKAISPISFSVINAIDRCFPHFFLESLKVHLTRKLKQDYQSTPIGGEIFYTTECLVIS
jgi:hypothetical protein